MRIVRTYLVALWWILAMVAPVGADEPSDPFFVPRPDFYAAEERPRSAGSEDVTRPNLVRQIGLDFKNVFTTKENAYIIAAGLIGGWAMSPFDESIAESGFNSEASLDESSLDLVFETGEIAGAGHVQLAAALATYGIGRVFESTEVGDLGRELVRAQVVASGLTYVLKKAVGRDRPDGSSATSFPSGHTAASFATATVLKRCYGWDIGVPAYAFAAYVGASRLNEGKHFISDVIVGAAIGIMSGRTVMLDLGTERFALAPMVVPGGAGVQLAWVDGSP